MRAGAMWQAARAAHAARRFGECAQLFEAAAGERELGHDEAALRLEAAACHEEGGAFGPAIAGFEDWLTRFPGEGWGMRDASFLPEATAPITFP